MLAQNLHFPAPHLLYRQIKLSPPPDFRVAGICCNGKHMDIRRSKSGFAEIYCCCGAGGAASRFFNIFGNTIKKTAELKIAEKMSAAGSA